MSTFKRAPGPSGPSRQSVLAPLRAAQIIDTKPVLPAELIATILDYVSVPDLVRFARVSKRIREMVYDDSRWVQRLKSMGCWNEAEARQRFEESLRRKHDIQKVRGAEEARGLNTGMHKGVNGITTGGSSGRDLRKPSVTVFDADLETQKRIAAVGASSKASNGQLDAGFTAMTLSPDGEYGADTGGTAGREYALDVLKRVRSIRGFARQEYGKAYKALAPLYCDLLRSTTHDDPIIFKTYTNPEHQAQMLAQLRRFAKSDFTQERDEREDKLESMIRVFENAVLREFEQGYEDNDFDGRMKRYAHVLVTLNGPTGGVDLFIQKHPLISRKDYLGNPLDCLNRASSGSVSLQPSLDFFRQAAIELTEVASTIDRVFPPSADVLLPFVNRVCEDVIADYVGTLFDEAHERNIESYLKAVSGVFEQSLRFSKSLKPTKVSHADFPKEVFQVVARVFEPHVKRYLEEELAFFRQRSNAEVEAWEKQLSDQQASTESFLMSNINRQAAKNDFLSSFRKVIMMPVNALPSIPVYSPFTTSKPTNVRSSLNEDSLNVPSRSATPGSVERSPSPNLEAPTSELAAKAAVMKSRLEGIRSLFSIEVALTLIHAAKSSIERIAIFARLGGSPCEEAKEQCEQIFIHLLQLLGTRHIKAGFDKAVSHLSTYKPREVSNQSSGSHRGVAPLVTFLELVNVGDLIQQMVEVFYAQELVAPKLTDSDDFLNLAAKEKKRFEQMLDERVAAGLNKGIDVLMDEVEFLCATTQLPTDFNPEGNSSNMDIGPTETARRVVDVVSSHTDMLNGTTDKTVLDVFNQEVGLRLFAELCKHIKRQRISTEGAIRLISDTTHYYTYIVSLRNKDLTRYFAALRALSQMYLIESTHAKEIAAIIADVRRYHGIFPAEEVYEFAERRTDWLLVRKEVERAMYGIGCIAM